MIEDSVVAGIMLDRLVGGVVLVRAESGEYVSGVEIKDDMFVCEGGALCLRREVVLIALEPAQVVAIEFYEGILKSCLSSII